jgi:renalase
MVHDVLVIGAGLAGLACAERLAGAGQRVLVVDKARGVGGRLATRRGEGVTFDHGAQYFTARDPRFSVTVGEWAERGLVAPWQARIMAFDGHSLSVSGPETRYVGLPGMNAICKAIAARLDVQCERRVVLLVREDSGWRATDASGAVFTARQLVITAPPAQSAALLAPWPAFQRVAEGVAMAPCWAVMLELSEPLPVDFDGCFVNAGPLRWVARNSSKPGRPATETWVLHASAEWTSDHLDAAPAEVVQRLCDAMTALAPSLGASIKVVTSTAHRWLYSQADAPLREGCFWWHDATLGLAGDWLAGSRVEGAWLSGDGLAERMLADGN